jgi:hypothetical protein
MNDPDLLQRISNEAIAFDRAHFDDGIDPVPETMVEHHLRLTTDRKLITRLQPRFAVALGFFEGYAKAIEDAAKVVPEDRVHLASWLREAFRGASSGSENAKNLDALIAILNDPKNIGIVVKPPPPPPPPIVPSAPNELRTEIDDELAQAAVHVANDLLDRPRSLARDLPDDMVCVRRAVAERGTREMGTWEDLAIAFVEGALWELARIENAHAGDEPTMRFPPAFDPPSMPSDSQIVDLICRTIHADHNFSEQKIHNLNKALDNDAESLRRLIGMYTGSIAEACTVKFALLHLLSSSNQPANECSDSERAQYETTIAQQKARIEELEAKYLQKKGDYKTAMEVISDLHVALRSFALPTNPKALAAELSRRQKEMEKLPDEVQPGSGILYIDEDNKVMFRGSLGQETVVGSPESAIDSPTPLIFRDESERDFWDEQVHTLNRRGDRSPSDVARAADEMVEERRKRMPSVATNCAAISDELLLEAAAYANEFCELKSDRTDLQNAKSAMNGNMVVALRWSNAVRSYVNGAIRKARKP